MNPVFDTSQVNSAAGMARLWLAAALALLFAGCGSGKAPAADSSDPPAATPAAAGPRTYFSAAVAGGYPVGAITNSSSNLLATYLIDDTKKTFAETTYAFGATQDGAQLNYSGTFTVLPRGLLDLKATYSYGSYGTNLCSVADCSTSLMPAVAGAAVELAGQAGGFLQLDGLPFTPLVAAESCPASKTAQTYQFVTIPGPLGMGSDNAFDWDPALDTAYGSVDVGVSGSSVLFSNIQQFTIAGDQLRNYSTLASSPVAYTSISGSCSPTFYGDTISVPGSLTIGSTQGVETFGVSATVGIGPSGLLVENNGSGNEASTSSGSALSAAFQPFLGAGSGAVGLPKPASALSMDALTGAQYLGFVYNINSQTDWSSTLASFGGFPSSLPSSCASVVDTTGSQTNGIFGGDFPNNDPTMTGDAGVATFGNCDLSIYLNGQDPANAGLYPNATVTVGANFSGNTAGETYSAVAIAGQLQGKFAIFLISSAGEGIYLLQSN